MRVIGIALVALLAACATVHGVPSTSARLQNQHVLQETASAQLHDECLKEIGKHLMDWEPPKFGAKMFEKDVVKADAAHRINLVWPTSVNGRATCEYNANWVFAMFQAKNTQLSQQYSVTSQAGDQELTKSWSTDALWENSNTHAFPKNGRTCYMEIADGNKNSPVMHQWVLEAPTNQLVRHYQSFVGCYTLDEWMTAGNAPQEGTAYSAGCDFLAARAAYGGGALLTRGQSATNTYVAHVQAIIAAIAAGNNFQTVAADFTALFGVTVDVNYNWKTPSFNVKCVDRVPLTCSHQQQALHHELSRYRKALGKLALDDTQKDLTYLKYEALGVWERAITHATNKGWTAAAKNLRKNLDGYQKHVDKLATAYCRNGEREYRKVLRADSGFMALKDEVDNITKLQKSFSVNADLQGNPLAVRLASKNVKQATVVLTCKKDAVKDTYETPGVAQAYRPACDVFVPLINGKALPKELIQAKKNRVAGAQWGATRWELQVCTNTSGAPTKARFIPSASMQ